MVDRIDKLDPKTYRVQDTDPNRQSRQQGEQQEEEDKERDKFEKKASGLKRLMPESSGKLQGHVGKIWGGQGRPQPHTVDALPDSPNLQDPQDEDSNTPLIEEDEISLSLSQRMFVIWGVMDLNGRYRIQVIAAYAAVGLVIITASLLMIGILWR